MRPLSFEDDLSQQIDQAEPAMLFRGTSEEELRAWQHAFRQTLAGLLGRRPERASLEMEIEDTVHCDSYVRQRIRYQTEPDVWVPAYLLTPEGLSQSKRAPGVLCLHGHGHFGKDSVVGIDDTPERQEEITNLRYDYGDLLARQGYVVLGPDLRGFGERRPDYPEPRIDYCPRNYMCATLLGTTVVALHLCDLTAALDVLETVDCVDSEMLACAGLSLGGRMTMMIAALDDRVRLAVPSGCLNLFQERYQALVQCGAQLIPGLLLYGDTPEIFSLIAPRPMVLEVGLRDPLIPHKWAERGLARVRRAYEAAGAADRLFVDEFDGQHEFHGTVSVEVLDRWRKGTL